MPRIAVVKKELCNPQSCGGYLCMRVCPVNRQGTECIEKDDDGKVKIHADLCIGCGICPNKCPFDAIYITNLPEKLAKRPIHTYGKNGFHLYSLPTPMFGRVVGVLGRNGIGKSTAIKILAGVLKPNLGRPSEASYEELINYFKGSEAQNFFEKIKGGKIKAAYKPQQVELIPKTAKGTVRDLLLKVDEKGEFEKVVEELDLKYVLDTDITKISGGELQRVAIAATVLKKANLYIFDEPTSYLDIKQRVNVSRFIKRLADEQTAVLVVEHDLIILDYMTDLIHVMFGQEGAYGIVSQPKNSRVGMNMYLSGFLKDENMRFRESEITFIDKAPFSSKTLEPLTSWTALSKELGRFLLESPGGSLSKNQVIGILGENGTGKTSFVKLLAKVIEPDKGELDEKVTVSYKPQYLQSGSDELVMSVLGDAVETYEAQIMRPLDIKPLLLKQLNQLSGGELQRVSIALCLSREADLYLLDEPSAYLDVEQRLAVSKLIRDVAEARGKSVVVVDHDLLFIDYLSEGLMVFEGEPGRRGTALGPLSVGEGMNRFLKDVDLTFRRDPESHRPRANKPGSQMDREQRAKNALYYV